jgi:GxxExxY protein
VERELSLPIIYEGVRLEAGFRIDLLVNDLVIVELKAVEEMHPVFDAQMITYLKLTEKRLGILINFNVRLIKDGIKRIIL